MTERHLLTMFAKAPIAGRVKTRLTPPLTPSEAADLHACFLLDQAERLLLAPSGQGGTSGRLSVAGELDHPVIAAIGALGVEVVEQRGGDLGDRMATAIEEGLADGFTTVTLIGSDSPTLPVELVQSARRSLMAGSDVALAPSFDGGFVLIGASRPAPALRQPIAWSTEVTLVETIDRLRRDKHLVALQGFWYDVDQASDLDFLARHLLGALGTQAETIAPRTARWLAEHGIDGALH